MRDLTSIFTLLVYIFALLFLPTSSAATTTAGFGIPANITEGHLYVVTIDRVTGREIHTRLDSLLPPVPPPPPPPPRPESSTHHPNEKRGISSTTANTTTDTTTSLNANAALAAVGKAHPALDWPPRAFTYCGDGYIQASDLLDKVIASFTDQCDRSNAVYLYNTQAVYAAHGTAVAYMCNFSPTGNPCRSAEFLDALGLIADRCKWSQGGVLQIGEVILKGWKKGYGYTSNLDRIPICGPKGGRWGPGIKGWKEGIKKHEGEGKEDSQGI